MTKTHKIPFSKWKTESRKYIGLNVHITMDGTTEKVIVKPIKSK